ncbi:MAG: LysR family transcriptional regulator [Pseudooceanicola sp.]|nr:LysR family transcriptional regulator [Pseudooceanicola sp.]
MKPAHLRDLVAATRVGGPRAAARHPGIAQPWITRSIRDVKHDPGGPLFARHQQGVRLTAIGDALLRRAGDAIGQTSGEVGRAHDLPLRHGRPENRGDPANGCPGRLPAASQTTGVKPGGNAAEWRSGILRTVLGFRGPRATSPVSFSVPSAREAP